MKEKIRIGISEIRSARREYIREFWKVFSDVLGVEVVYSGIDLMAAYEKGKRFLNESNSYCFFRNLDIGQHIDLIEKNVDVLILLSLRETGKKVCNTECYVPEHLALAYPNMKICGEA